VRAYVRACASQRRRRRASGGAHDARKIDGIDEPAGSSWRRNQRDARLLPPDTVAVRERDLQAGATVPGVQMHS